MFRILRPLLFAMNPETAHNFILWLLRLAGHIPAGRWLLRKCYAVEHPSLEREVFGLHFKNPIGVAAGFDRNAEVYRELAAMGFGFVEVGTVTPRPQTGNPKPRIFRSGNPDDPSILYRTGVANKGLERAISRLRRPHDGTVVGCNISKNSITPVENQPADYLKLFRNLYQYVDYFTVHVSYNAFSRDSSAHTKQNVLDILMPLFDFRRGQNEYRPILLKISADLPDEVVDEMTDIMLETPLDGIVAVNAPLAREKVSTAKVSSIAAFASGRRLTERAIEVVRRIHRRSNGLYPIIGVGGLMTPEDIRAMLDAGATLVQLYTGLVYNGMKLVRDTCHALILDAGQADRDSRREDGPNENPAEQ
ncbi:MAG: quinone-dependent dihydroorotate dehydrogenase [Alistipes sp.]|nr:quinone-dependent dihydroorotate dehydrogenase [Alistipes sp.]